MPKVMADFAGVIKGKRTISSLKEAADSELARAKIEASRIGDLIRTNLKSLNELASKHGFLFADAQELVLKANDDLVALIKVRINEHEQQQAELARQTDASQAAQQQPTKEPVQPVAEQAKPLAATPITSAAPAVQPAADDGQRIKLGEICRCLGFTLTADFLRSLGFEAVERDRSAMLYRAADFPRICSALVVHVQGVQNSQAAA